MVWLKAKALESDRTWFIARLLHVAAVRHEQVLTLDDSYVYEMSVVYVFCTLIS